MIPESFIQDVLARVDIVELIDGYVPLKKAGANHVACCPFHNEKSPSFTVSPSKQFYHCFGCGAHGTAIGFLMEYQGVGFVDAIKELAARVGMPVPQDDFRPGVSGAANHGTMRGLVEVMTRAMQYYREQLKQAPQAIQYLKQRGLTGEIAAKFGIGYAPDGWQNLEAVFADYHVPELLSAGLVIENEAGRRYDRFRDRVMFPILNQKGEVIAFGGRVMGVGEPKYLNSPETPLFEKGRELFGLPQARSDLRATDTAVVVEGYMDVVALAQHGVGNALATLGTATTTTHVQKLLRQVDRIVFCFDGDAAGRKAAWRALENALEALSDNKRIGFVFLPDTEDPDSYVRARGAEAFQQLIREATPLSDFLLRELALRCDLSSSEGKAKLIYEAKPLLQKLPTPLLRLQLVKRAAEVSGFAQAEVERLCELKSFARPALPKAPRRAPSLSRMLLRLVLQNPELVVRLPIDQLPDAPERSALLCLHRLVGQNGAMGYAALRERLRGAPEEAVIEAAAVEFLDSPLDAEEIESEFLGVLERLREGGHKRDFNELQGRVRRLGVAGLTPEEKQEYLRLLSASGKEG